MACIECGKHGKWEVCDDCQSIRVALKNNLRGYKTGFLWKKVEKITKDRQSKFMKKIIDSDGNFLVTETAGQRVFELMDTAE